MKTRIFLLSILLLVAIFISFNNAKASIIYSDIIPDSIVSATTQQIMRTFDVDLNNDGEVDFIIAHFHPSDDLQLIEMFSVMDKESEILVDENNIPIALSKDDLIDFEQSTWYNSNAQALHMSDNWAGVADKYLGLRIKISSIWHYGWVRLTIPEDEINFTIKDYAYESTPGTGIAAGDNGSSDAHNKKTFIMKNSVFPNPFSNSTTIKYNLVNPTSVRINIYNALGNKITTLKDGFQNAGELQAIFDAENLAPGMYYYTIQIEASIENGKLLLIR